MNLINENKILNKMLSVFDKIFEGIFIIVFILYIISITLHHSNIFSMSIPHFLILKTIKYTLYTFVLITAYSIITLQFNFKSTIIIILIGVLLLINYVHCRDGRLVLIYCAVISAKNYNYEKLIKIAFFSIMFSCILVLLCRLLNVIPDISEDMSRNNGIVRHGLGFSVANVSGYNLTAMVLLYISYKKESIKILNLILFAITNMVIFYFTNTRFPFILINLAIILYLLLKYHYLNINNIFIKAISIFIYIICSSLIIILSVLYGYKNGIAVYINKVLTGRLALSWSGINNFGLSLFGKVVNFKVNGYDVIDSSYINALIIFGVVAFILIVLFFTILQYVSYKNNKNYIVLALFIFAIYSTFDGILLMFNLNVLPIIFIPLFNNLIMKRNKSINYRVVNVCILK